MADLDQQDARDVSDYQKQYADDLYTLGLKSYAKDQSAEGTAKAQSYWKAALAQNPNHEKAKVALSRSQAELSLTSRVNQ